MSLFKDGKLNEDYANSLVKAIANELMKRDKEYLATKLAIEVVSQEIQEHLDRFISERRLDIERLEEKNDALRDNLLEEWEGRRREWMIGVRTINAARKRRKGRPGRDPQIDEDRNSRMRRYYERLVSNGDYDPVSQTAIEFNLSVRQTRRIVKNS